MTSLSLKSFKPFTSTTRSTILLTSPEITKNTPYKKLIKGLNKKSGRNNHGHITSRHRGGFAKRLYRIIELRRSVISSDCTVETIEYDPNRNALISLIKEKETGKCSYIIAPDGMKVGDILENGKLSSLQPGSSAPLSVIPVGTHVHAVQANPGSKSTYVRSAGTYATIVSKDFNDLVLLLLPSGEQKYFHQSCYATVGIVSNPLFKNVVWGKAGRTRKMGKRPHVRAICMNPVDHPMGGRTSGGRHPCTPWGKSSKGFKTVRNKQNSRIIKKS
jgi:large subunit ribosomal protein L2